MVEAEHQHIGDGKAQGEDLGWRKPIEHQYLGSYKGGTPNRHREKGDEVIEYVAILSIHHKFSFLFCKIKIFLWINQEFYLIFCIFAA